jgi:hypothetical protein
VEVASGVISHVPGSPRIAKAQEIHLRPVSVDDEVKLAGIIIKLHILVPDQRGRLYNNFFRTINKESPQSINSTVYHPPNCYQPKKEPRDS